MNFEMIEILWEDIMICSGLENRQYGRRDPSHWPGGTLYPQKLALTSPKSGGRSFGIVHSRTQATYRNTSQRLFGINEGK
jgi:hypothetical protein